MKKFVLSAGLFLALTATSFAMNSETASEIKTMESAIEKIAYPCKYNILIKNKNGDVVKTIAYDGTTPGDDSGPCCDWSANNVKIWQAQLVNSPGYTVESDLVV
jgi:hypothetical protein